MSKKQKVIYGLVGGVSLLCYFLMRQKLANFKVSSFIVSNFTLNYLLLFLCYYGLAFYFLFVRPNHIPYLLKWVIILGGFFIILLILTIGGLHTRL